MFSLNPIWTSFEANLTQSNLFFDPDGSTYLGWTQKSGPTQQVESGLAALDCVNLSFHETCRK